MNFINWSINSIILLLLLVIIYIYCNFQKININLLDTSLKNSYYNCSYRSKEYIVDNYKLIMPDYIEYTVTRKSIVHSKPKIVIAVLSSTYNFRKRYSFRYNSITQCSNKEKCLFLFFVGVSYSKCNSILEQEFDIYNDIIQFSLINSYYNLTLLSIMALKYCFRKFSTLEYYIKTDDDILINYPLLYTVLYKTNKKNKLVYGSYSGRFKVNRSNRSKSFIPSIQYPHTYFPEYVYGGLTIITKASMHLLYYQTQFKQKYIWKEDCNLGYLCKLCNISVLQYPFGINLHTKRNTCTLPKNIIAAEMDSRKDKYYCIRKKLY